MDDRPPHTKGALGAEVGFCGRAPSNHPDFGEFLVENSRRARTCNCSVVFRHHESRTLRCRSLVDTPKREGTRRTWRGTRCSPRIEYRAEIAALMHRIREVRDRLPLGDETSVEIAWLVHQLVAVRDRHSEPELQTGATQKRN